MNIRKCLSIALCFALVCAALPFYSTGVSAVNVWSGSVSAPTLLNGKYQIASGEQLAWFAAFVNAGNAEASAVLTADIVLNSGTPSAGANVWTPIGTEQAPFSGTLLGEGHSVSGVYINSESAENVGLIGYMSGDASVTGLSVLSSYIRADQNVGGIVGYANNSSVVSCTVSAEIIGLSGNIGGAVGYAANTAAVTNCDVSGSVSGAQRVGGITGYCFSNSVISGCKSSASVSASGNNVGGISGTVSGSLVEGSYSRGTVRGTNRVGGVVGYSAYGNLKNCYNIAPVTGTGDAVAALVAVRYGGSVRNCYYDAERCVASDSYATACGSADMKTSAFVTLLNDEDYAFMFDYLGTNGGYPIHVREFGVLVWTGNLEQPSQDPSGNYLISCGEELAWFSGLVNGTLPGIAQNTAANAKVTGYILLNFGSFTSQSKLFTPIGSASAKYTGSFDGGGFVIGGLYIRSSANNIGLFGYIGAGGTVKNVRIENSDIYGSGSNVGGIAGSCAGSIIGCVNCANVGCNVNSSGGIVGALVSSGSVTQSYFLGSIRGNYYVGGIVGSSVSAVSECFSNGSVIGNYDVAGIVGYNNAASSVQRCFNSGSVSANGDRVGGISGKNASTVEDCYNTGAINGLSTVGGLVAENLSTGRILRCFNAGPVSSKNELLTCAVTGSNLSGTVSACYYDSVASIASDALAASCATLDMTGYYALNTLSGLSPSVFRARSNSDTYFNFYPQLVCFFSSAVQEIRDISTSSVKILKAGYCAMAAISGGSSVYFNSVSAAVAYIGEAVGTVTLLGDSEISSAVTVDGNITLVTDGGSYTLTRSASGMSARSMFEVGGSLSFGTSMSGSDTSPSIILDGNGSVTTGRALVEVAQGGSLRVYAGTVMKNNVSSENGGAVLVDGGSMTLFGGLVTLNSSQGTNGGGGIAALNGGEIYLEGGKISENSASSGGGIYVGDAQLVQNGGSVTLNRAGTGYGGGVCCEGGSYLFDGGTVSGNETGGIYGGGVYISGDGAEMTIDSGAAVSSNKAPSGSGGGIAVSGASVTIAGGSVTDNSAYRNGGGIDNSGELVFSSGEIASNFVVNGSGGGIYNNGSFSMSGAATVDSDNSVYLVNGKTVTLSAKLTSAGSAATLVPEIYSSETRVLDGAGAALNRSAFTVAPKETAQWYITSGGYLTDIVPAVLATVIKPGGATLYYTSFADAVEGIGTGIGTIYMMGDDLIYSTVSVRGNVTVLTDGNARTIMRAEGFSGDMIKVESNAALKLGSSMNNAEDTLLTFDGGSQEGRTGGVIVSAEGTLYLYNGASLLDNVGGGVRVTGGFYMYGGAVAGNSSVSGGGVYVDSGKFSLLGGSLLSNVASGSGGGAFITGGGEMLLSACAVLVSSGDDGDVYHTERGTVTGNTALDGGGIYVGDGSLVVCADLTLETQGTGYNTLYSLEANGIYRNTATRGGGGVFVGGAGSLRMDSSVIRNNSAAKGGGAYVAAGGEAFFGECVYDGYYDIPAEGGREAATFSFGTAIVRNNKATVSGGGLLIENGASVSVEAVKLYSDTAPCASAVWQGGALEIGGSAELEGEIYLADGKHIKVASSLETQSAVITVAMENMSYGETVLSGEAFAESLEFFALNNSDLYIKEDGTVGTLTFLLATNSDLTIDRNQDIIYGIDLDSNTAQAFAENFRNDYGEISVYNSDGSPLADALPVYTGCIVRLTADNGDLLDESKIVVFGDIDGDARITASDAMYIWLIYDACLAEEDLTAEQYLAADADRDGYVDILDYELVAKVGIGLENVAQA